MAMTRGVVAPIVIAAVACAAGASRLVHAQSGPVTFYVATNGNDAWSGRSPDAGAGTNGPFATMQRARDAVRELKRQQSGSLRQPITIEIREGTYFLTDTLLLEPEDSGTANAPITYAAYQDERPVISGGRQVTGWRPLTVDGKDLWVAYIPEALRPTWYFHQLWVNGERRTRARHPNQGLLRIAEVPDATSDWEQGQNRFRYTPGDIKPWRRLTDVEVVTYNQWSSAHLPIAGIDEGQRIVTFDRRSNMRLTERADSLIGAPYHVENAFEFLDAPGERYLDRDVGTVYYLPMPGEDMTHSSLLYVPNSTYVGIQDS